MRNQRHTRLEAPICCHCFQKKRRRPPTGIESCTARNNLSSARSLRNSEESFPGESADSWGTLGGVTEPGETTGGSEPEEELELLTTRSNLWVFPPSFENLLALGFGPWECDWFPPLLFEAEKLACSATRIMAEFCHRSLAVSWTFLRRSKGNSSFVRPSGA